MIDAGDGRVFLLGLTMVRTGEHDDKEEGRGKRKDESTPPFRYLSNLNVMHNRVTKHHLLQRYKK